MRPKSLLFSLSLLFLIGCSQEESQMKEKMELKIDSIQQVHSLASEDLAQQIQALEKEVSDLSKENDILKDSIENIALPPPPIIRKKVTGHGDPIFDSDKR